MKLSVYRRKLAELGREAKKQGCKDPEVVINFCSDVILVGEDPWDKTSYPRLIEGYLRKGGAGEVAVLRTTLNQASRAELGVTLFVEVAQGN